MVFFNSDKEAGWGSSAVNYDLKCGTGVKGLWGLCDGKAGAGLSQTRF